MPAKTHYFIGIGGTGARLAESLIHLCAAGLGPASLTLFLVDPDQGNGNLERTKALASKYEHARRAFADRAEGVDLFRTDISFATPFAWDVFDTKKVSLSDHIHLNALDGNERELADFARVLFSNQELSTALDQGFRGHPNIGAVVLSDVPRTEKGDPWKTFWTDVDRAHGEGEVDVFFAGSIFGGTGAAGVPTFGAPGVLKQDPLAAMGGGKSKIRLGAGLVLPYFTFEPGDEPSMHVTPADFALATRAALSYYASKDLAYDDVYLFGDSLGQSVGSFSPGNAAQRNAPHYIELAGALAALDFFGSTPVPGGGYFHASRPNEAVNWEDLPVSRDSDAVQDRSREVKNALATLATFAYTVLGYGLPELKRSPDDIDDVWFTEHFYPKIFGLKRVKTKHPRLTDEMAALETVGAYLEAFVEWAAALDDGPDGNVKLFAAERLRSPEGGVPSHDARPTAIGSLLRGPSQNLDFTAYKNVLNEVDVQDKPTKSVSNADRFVNLFHTAARQFVQANYAR